MTTLVSPAHVTLYRLFCGARRPRPPPSARHPTMPRSRPARSRSPSTPMSPRAYRGASFRWPRRHRASRRGGAGLLRSGEPVRITPSSAATPRANGGPRQGQLYFKKIQCFLLHRGTPRRAPEGGDAGRFLHRSPHGDRRQRPGRARHTLSPRILQIPPAGRQDTLARFENRSRRDLGRGRTLFATVIAPACSAADQNKVGLPMLDGVVGRRAGGDARLPRRPLAQAASPGTPNSLDKQVAGRPAAFHSGRGSVQPARCGAPARRDRLPGDAERHARPAGPPSRRVRPARPPSRRVRPARPPSR